MFQSFTDHDDRSSYEILAAHLHPRPRTHHILDMGCGDGFLLQLLARQGFTSLTGVDASPHELRAARERLGSTARLSRQDARSMSLSDDSVDVVVCHMVLMLLSPLASVLAEVARLLRPGGRFVAVVNRALRDPAYDVYRQTLHRITRKSGMGRLQLGDPRVFTEAGLIGLFSDSPLAGGDLSIEDFCIRTRASPQSLWSMLRRMYDVFRLPAAAQTALEQELMSGWQPLCDDRGQLTCALGMRLVECHTPGHNASP